jgi:ADP-heptose:LPS heptosyltransferase
MARVPRRHGSAPAPWSWLLYTHRAPWLGKDPLIHERDRMLQVIEAPDRIGAMAREWTKGTGLPRLRASEPTRAEKLAGASFGKYWLINPTASRREKAWPAARFRELFSRLKPRLEEQSMELRLIGAPMETEWLRECLPEGLDPARFIVQPARILDLMDALSGAKLLVTNTSSAQFLCPGLGVRTLTLMGCADPRIWGPLGSDALIVRATSETAAGSDLFEKERKAYESIELERVLAECEKVLRG